MPNLVITPRTALAVAARPWLWSEAARALVRFAPQGWARRRSLPLPPDDFARFRAQTASGGDGATMSGADVVAWLKWCRSFRQVVR
jgi:hypothetical protein